MIYRDRKYLSILTLTEDRDYVTYDELIHVLEERPSDAVYIEWDGILCGLITFGRILRRFDKKTHCVPFNKKYAYVHPEEYWYVRQIFRDKAKINMLPVVSEDGRLLGDYVRWDDYIVRNHAELLLKAPCVLQGLKENIPNVFFVEPAVRGEANKDGILLWWKQKLKSEGINLQVIQHREVKDYLNVANTFLFVDEDEKHGIDVLNRCLYQRIVPMGYTIINYLYRIRQLASARLNESILKELQNQGVFVLLFDVKENSKISCSIK